MSMIDGVWQQRIDELEFAFQPVVSMSNGKLFGFEALLRGELKAGFETLDSFFDAAYKDGMLYEVDLELRRIAFDRFCELKKILLKQYEKNSPHLVSQSSALKIFYNIDQRIMEMIDYKPGNTKHLLKNYDLHESCIYFDISERHRFSDYIGVKSAINTYKLQGFKVALDDFGSGHSGFELLYHAEPDVVKLDRYLVKNIRKETKNRLFCMEIIKMAHIRGALVLAEGVETKEEFFALKEVGCDLAQGFFILKPTSKLKDIPLEFETLKECLEMDMRKIDLDAALIKEQLEQIEPIGEHELVISVVERFKKDESAMLFPVIDEYAKPLGLITEKVLRKYIYSNYGLQIIQNQTVSKYITSCPVVDVSTPLEELLDIFANTGHHEGIIVSENFQYRGFLGTKSLLNALNEKNMSIARDQNPLTKLPGNHSIGTFVENAMSDLQNSYLLVYFDLDNFKPFNDKFGFRQGDRAILLFADTLKEQLANFKPFVGHIGGDDFFAGFVEDGEDAKVADILKALKSTLKIFAQNSESFYGKEDRKSGFIMSKDRFGVERSFALLTASAAAVHLEQGTREFTMDELLERFAHLKKTSKASKEKLAFESTVA